MLHFGRDEGVEMAAAYHGVISTNMQLPFLHQYCEAAGEVSLGFPW